MNHRPHFSDLKMPCQSVPAIPARRQPSGCGPALLAPDVRLATFKAEEVRGVAVSLTSPMGQVSATGNVVGVDPPGTGCFVSVKKGEQNSTCSTAGSGNSGNPCSVESPDAPGTCSTGSASNQQILLYRSQRVQRRQRAYHMLRSEQQQRKQVQPHRLKPEIGLLDTIRCGPECLHLLSNRRFKPNLQHGKPGWR